MEKVFKNKTFAYIIAGALMTLQLASSIIKWSNGGFNGGSLILCILMLGLLIITGIGINKKKNLLMLIGGVAITSIITYTWTNGFSGALVKAVQDGTLNAKMMVWFISLTLFILLLLASLVLAIIKAFGTNKDLRKLNSIFCILGTIFAIISFVLSFVGAVTIVADKIPTSIFAMILPLLIASIGYQIEIKE